MWASVGMAACRGCADWRLHTCVDGRTRPLRCFRSEGAPLTFDTIAQAYMEDYVLQRYRTLTTARARVENLREFFGGWGVDPSQR